MALRPGPLRDALVLVAVFGILLSGLYAYTGTWPPAVIVESSSMMHPDSEVTYGRFGTIDPGDLVLVKRVDAPEDVQTLVEGTKSRYGKSGDVIVYYPGGVDKQTPIIHRAVAYVEVKGSGENVEFWVRWSDAPCEGGATKRDEWCVYGSEGVYAPSVPIQRLGSTAQNPQPYKPEHSGFLTKGDNPVTNRQIDQVSGLSETVKLEWIEGKGRAELPWLGLIKLSLAGRPNERNPPDEWTRIGSAYAPQDLWVCLGISLFLLVGVPLAYDGYKIIRARRTPALHAPRYPNATGGPGSVTIRWEPVAGAQRYRVYRGPNVVGETSDAVFTESGLDPDLSYVYTVAAVGPTGEEGPRSFTASAAPSRAAT